MKALITGGTGFIGHHLVKHFKQPIVLGRNPERIKKRLPGVTAKPWQQGRPLDPSVFDGVDVVFHLAGESIHDGRWNAAKKERIINSRVDGTRTIVEALSCLNNPPETLISASAIGYYGSRGDETLTESSTPGDDFLARVCFAWEKEARLAEKLGIRVVSLRIGVVLGREGGALAKMLPSFKFGFGGRLGSGSQYMSWIHVTDLVRIMLFAVENKALKGPVNGVASRPLTNREFTAELAGALHRPAIFSVPGFILRLALGEFATVLLGSQRVIPEKLNNAGFSFSYPDLGQAFGEAIK